MAAHLTHADCIACRDRSHGGLGLRFSEHAEGGVTARFDCDKAYQGYSDRVHGGILATLVDAAMTQCLLAMATPGVTARLDVRFRHPVQIGDEAEVRAWLERASASYFVLRAEVRQNGRICATARGLFAPAS